MNTSPGAFVSLAPARVLDTRSNAGAVGPIAASGTAAVQITGHGGVPTTGVAAVVLNITVVSPTAAGFISTYPDGTTRPNASNLNFVKGQTIPNLVVVPVGSNGRIRLFNGSAGTVQLLADVAGYYLAGNPTAAGAFVSLAPARVLDTRSNAGAVGPIAASGTAAVQITGHGGVPTTGVAAVVLNITVVSPTAAGFISAYPDGTTRPNASNLNFVKGQTIPNLVVVPVGSNGRIRLFNGSAGTVQLLADVAGYYLAGNPTVAGAFVSLAPARVLDTRSNAGAVGPIAASGTAAVQITGHGGVPTTGVAAVVLNITVVSPTAAGFISTYPDGTTRPNASNLNFVKGQTIPNLVVVPVGSNGRIRLFNGSAGTVQLLADVAGYYLAASSPSIQWGPDVTITPPHGPLTSVSCSSPGVCVAVDNSGHALTSTGTGWTSPVALDSVLEFNSVSCATATFCVAVDDIGTYQAYRFNGTDWTRLSSVDPFETLEAVSCPSITFCAAVDSSHAVTTHDGGTTWSDPVELDAGYVDAISCTSSTFCVASSGDGNVVTFDGQQWSPQTTITSNGLGDVTCVGRTFCVALDGAGGVETYNGSNWTTTAGVDINQMTSLSCATDMFCVAVDTVGAETTYNGHTWSTPQQIGNGHILAGVSCPTSTSCEAVAGDASGVVTVLTAGSWSNPVVIDDNSYLASMSCPTATFCVAGGYSGRVSQFDGSTWSPRVTVDLDNSLQGLSCPTTTFCVAVDNAGNYLKFNGDSWTLAANIDGTHLIEAVSCPTTTFCGAVDDSGSSITFDGNTWSTPTNVGTTFDLDTISCSSASFCVAADSQSHIFKFNGTSWSSTGNAGEYGLSSISCVSATFCAGVNYAGQASLYNGTTWTPPESIDPTDASGLSSVDCTSNSRCITVDHDGSASVFNGTHWTPFERAADWYLAIVSCPTANTCIALTTDNHSVTGTS